MINVFYFNIKWLKYCISIDYKLIFWYNLVGQEGFNVEELVMGFKEGSPLVSKINSSLTTLKQNGMIDTLKSKYAISLKSVQ